MQDYLEKRWYSEVSGETLVHREWTGFSDLALTSHPDRGLTLYLDRQFQWSLKQDLDYYHESLAVPAGVSFLHSRGHPPRNALILGGGDGFLADRLLRILDLESITLIDIDPRVSALALQINDWRDAGGSSVASPKVLAIHEDAYDWVIRNSRKPKNLSREFDLVFMDLPDPRSAALARFFTTSFFSHLRKLAPRSVLSIQASSDVRRPGGARNYLCTLASNLEAASASTLAVNGKEQDAFVLASWSGPILLSANASNAGSAGKRIFEASRWFTSQERLSAWAAGSLATGGSHCKHLQGSVHTLLRPGILDL